MPHLGDPGIDFCAGELATLTRLTALRQLDLQIGGIDQVLAGYPEATGGDLLYCAATPVAVGIRYEASGILAPLSGIRPGAQPVHGNSQRFVGLLADGAVRHGPGGEALEDRLDGLNLFDWNRLLGALELEQPPKGAQVLAGIVDQRGVLLEDGILAGPCRVLQLRDRLGVQEMILAVSPPLIFTAPLKVWLTDGSVGEGLAMAEDHLF